MLLDADRVDRRGFFGVRGSDRCLPRGRIQVEVLSDPPADACDLPIGEVDDFLDRIAEVMNRLERENAALQTRLRELDHMVETSRSTGWCRSFTGVWQN